MSHIALQNSGRRNQLDRVALRRKPLEMIDLAQISTIVVTWPTRAYVKTPVKIDEKSDDTNSMSTIAISRRVCPKCSAPTFKPSRPHGGVEQILFVLGANILRCHACADRNLYFLGLEFRARDRTRDADLEWVVRAIVGGILTCAMIAFWVLRRFHRLPF